MFNQKLFECAQFAVGLTKEGFMPPMPPSAGAPPGGMPPGAPPGGAPAAPSPAPPMDPAAMAGGAAPMPPAGPAPAPPGDPGAGAAPPPPSPGGFDPETLRMIVREELSQGAGGGAGKSPAKAKIDPAQMYAEQVRTRKLLVHLLSVLDVGIPANVLDEPGEAGQQDQGKGQSGGQSDGQAGAAQKSAIAPLTPMQPAMPVAKTAELSPAVQAEALWHLLRAAA